MTSAPADLPEGRRQDSGGEGIEPEFKIKLSFKIDKPTCLKRQHCSCTLSWASRSSTWQPESLLVQGWGSRSISRFAEWLTHRCPLANDIGALQVGQRKVRCTQTLQMRWPLLQHGTGASLMVSMQTGHSRDDCRFSTNLRWEAKRALYCASKSGVSDVAVVDADEVVGAVVAGVDASQCEQPGRGATSCSWRLLLTASSMSAAYCPPLSSRLARFAGRPSSASALSPSATGPGTSGSLLLDPGSPAFSPTTIPRPALKTLRTSAADSAA